MGRASLIIVLGFTVVFGSIQRDLYRKSLRATDNFVRDYERTVAQNIANSAANIVRGRLRNDFNWRPDPNPSAPCSLFGGSYSLLVEDGSTVPELGNRVRITLTGTVNNTSQVVRVELKPTYTYFNSVAFAETDINLGLFSVIDGPVGSNGDINLGLFGRINGDATAGGSVNVGWGGTVTGTKTEGAEQVSLAPVDSLVAFYADPANNDNDEHGLGDVLTLGWGESLTLTSGNYYFTSINLGVNSNLITDGAVRIYCSGGITTHAISNLGQDSGDLLIFSSGSDNIWIGLAADFYGALYAPNATVIFPIFGELYGSVVAKEVNNGIAARLHFDEALAYMEEDEGNFVSGLGIASWWE